MTSRWVVELTSLAVTSLAVACGGAAQPGAKDASRQSEPSEAAASAEALSISYQGGDGSSCAERILIVGAKGEADGVASEYEWIERHYPGAGRKSQALTQCGEAPVDKLVIVTREGQEVTLVFDISGFFGKL